MQSTLGAVAIVSCYGGMIGLLLLIIVSDIIDYLRGRNA